MTQIIMIGLDLAKNVFQVHGVDARERWCCSGSCVAVRW